MPTKAANRHFSYQAFKNEDKVRMRSNCVATGRLLVTAPSPFAIIRLRGRTFVFASGFSSAQPPSWTWLPSSPIWLASASETPSAPDATSVGSVIGHRIVLSCQCDAVIPAATSRVSWQKENFFEATRDGTLMGPQSRHGLHANFCWGKCRNRKRTR